MAQLDTDSGLMTMDGFDDCIMGLVERYGMEPVILYDKVKVLEKLMTDMDEEDALEWFEFNMIGAWVGEMTPAFFEPIDDIDLFLESLQADQADTETVH